MRAVDALDGDVVRLWFRLAADALGRTRSAIDMLNVFPVPDADTGTNLHRTIACAADALAELPAQASAADIWHAATTAALRGACGNSGIIVSQLLRGLADTCGPASPCDGQVVATALARAAVLARTAVHRPLEGTVLTVADAAALAAAQASGLADVGRAAALGARQALIRTQQQLAALTASGVVDAGGAGLCVLLDALSAAISGTHAGAYEIPEPTRVPSPAALAWPAAAQAARNAAPPTSAGQAAAASAFAYEVTFLLDAPEHAVAALRDQLDRLGDSLVVSGGEPLWHVHAHVADAGAAIEAGLAAGRPSRITVTYLNGAHAITPAGRPARVSRIVAVADGPGLRELLSGAGADVVDSSAAGDPAAELDQIASSNQAAVLIAPAGRLTQGWPPGWPVIEAGSPVQSLAALAVHDPGRDQQADLAAMRRAAAGVRWGAIARPAPGGPGDPPGELLVGRIGGQVVASGTDLPVVTAAVLDRLLGPGTEMLTLVTGHGAGQGAGRLAADHIAAVAPGVEVVCYDGGMAGAVLLIGAE